MGYIFEGVFFEGRKVGGGILRADGGERERFPLHRAFLFPIARPAALALLIRLPLLPERKPVIVPVLDPFLFLARVAARWSLNVARHAV